MGVLVDIFGREFADDMATLVGGLDTYKEALKNAGDEAKKALYKGNLIQGLLPLKILLY